MALTLPKIQRRGVQRLTTPDISAPARMAQAEAAKTSAIAQGAMAIGGLANEFVQRKNRQDIRNATMAVHKADTDFRTANEGAEEFDIMAVEDENFIELADSMGHGDPEAPVPAHQIYADWRKKNHEDAVEKAAEGIMLPGVREEFIQNQKIKGEAAYANDAILATKKQIQYHAKKTIANVEKSLLNKDFDTARLEVATSSMSSEAKSNAMKSINKREQNDYFQETIENRSIPAMEEALTQLTTNNPKTTSELKANEQKVLANQLRTAIGTEKNAVSAGVNSQLQLVADDLKKQRDAVSEGRPINVLKMQENMTALAKAKPVLVREAAWALDFQEEKSFVMRQKPLEQEAIYNKMYDEASTNPSVESDYRLRTMKKSLDEQKQGYANDPMVQANKDGLIVLEGIDFSSVETLTAGLAQRKKQAISIFNQRGVFDGFFPKEELNRVGTFIENSPDKILAAKAFNAGLGEYAESAYDQLQKYGVQPVWALAGQLLAEDKAAAHVSDGIIKGGQMMKDDPYVKELMKQQGDTVKNFALSQFQGAFGGNPEKQKLMIQGLQNLYASHKGEVSKEDAFSMLTGGGFIEFQGAKVQGQYPNQWGITYTKNLRDTEDAWWELPENRANGFEPAQLKQAILNGDVKQLGISRGAALLRYDDGSFVKDAKGDNYIFKFDKDTPLSTTRYEKNRKLYLQGIEDERTADRQEEATAYSERFEKSPIAKSKSGIVGTKDAVTDGRGIVGGGL